MKRTMYLLFVFRFGVVVFAVAELFVAGAVAQVLNIDGTPLALRVDEYGTIAVFRTDGAAPVPQYYAGSAKGSVLFIGGEVAERWGNGMATFALWDGDDDRFTPVGHTKTSSNEIETVVAAGQTGLRVQQTVSYTPGDYFYTLRWQITGDGDAVFSDVRFLHGGDVSPRGADAAVGAWDAGSNMVYVLTTNQPADGLMGLQGDAGTPAMYHQEGHFELVRDACRNGLLPDTVDATLHDAAYALQWNTARLGPSDVWDITAYERWTGTSLLPSEFQVIAPEVAQLGFVWTLNRQTGTYFGTLTLRNVADAQGQKLSPPFHLVLDHTPDMFYRYPSGSMPDGRQYLDISAGVSASVAGGILQPGMVAVIDNIEVRMRYRQAPAAAAFSLWATSQVGPP